jgi:hypothetical protein
MNRIGLSIPAAALAATLLSLLSAAPMLGHFGASAYIIVPADHVLPGEPFEVVGADLTPNSNVTFTVQREGVTTTLEGSASGPDGHFTATLTIPEDFPGGYAQLFATATDGTATSTWVLVGARTASTPPPPGTLPAWADPSVLVLVVLVVGALGLVGFMLLRRRAATAPVRASEQLKNSRPIRKKRR